MISARNPVKISVIIPVYNTEPYLEKCLESIVNQSMGIRNMQIILVNDGSTDGSLRILNHYTDKYEEVVLVSTTNGGVSKARNKGITLATGEYLAFIDSDDYLPLDAFENMYNASEQATFDVVGGILNVKWLNGYETLEFAHFFRNSESEVVLDIEYSRTHQKIFEFCSACTKIFKREMILKNKLAFYDLGLGEDVVFVTLACLLANKIKLINHTVYNYIKRESSAMNNPINRKRNYIDAFEFCGHLYDGIDKYHLAEYKHIIDYVCLNHHFTFESRNKKLCTRDAIDEFDLSPAEFNRIMNIFMRIVKHVDMSAILAVDFKHRWIYLHARKGLFNETYHINHPNKISLILLPGASGGISSDCLSSIRDQTYHNFEVIIPELDDSIASLAQQIFYDDTRLVCVNRKNVSADSNYDSTQNIALGDFVLFVGGDDSLPKKSLENLHSVAISTNADVVCGAVAEGFEDSLEQLNNYNNFFIYSEGQNMRDIPPSIEVLDGLWGKLFKNSVLSDSDALIAGSSHALREVCINAWHNATNYQIIKEPCYFSSSLQIVDAGVHHDTLKHKVSIILPIHNVERYLENALKSIERQTVGLENLEVIMVNDGSTDASAKIIERYVNKHKKRGNFKAVHFDKASGAAGKPRNVGLEVATGEYMMYLDPDDTYEANAVEALYSCITKYDAELACGTYFQVDRGRNVHVDSKALFDNQEAYVVNITSNEKFLELPYVIWTKIIKRDFLVRNNIKQPEGIVSEDHVFCVQTLLLAKGIAFTPKPVVNYMIRSYDDDPSITFRMNLKFFEGLNMGRKITYDICINYDSLWAFKYSYSPYIIGKLILAHNMPKDDVIKAMSILHWFFQVGIDLKVNFNVPNNHVDYNYFVKLIEEKKYDDAYGVLQYFSHVKTLPKTNNQYGSRTDRSLAEQRLDQIYNMRSWRLVQSYQDFATKSRLGRLIRSIAVKAYGILNKLKGR